jgi:hypothetical protein
MTKTKPATCLIEGCFRPVRCRGLCARCYQRFLKYGYVELGEIRERERD